MLECGFVSVIQCWDIDQGVFRFSKFARLNSGMLDKVIKLSMKLSVDSVVIKWSVVCSS